MSLPEIGPSRDESWLISYESYVWYQVEPMKFENLTSGLNISNPTLQSNDVFLNLEQIMTSQI